MQKKRQNIKFCRFFTFPNGFIFFPLCYLLCRARCALRDDEVKYGGGRGTGIGDGSLRIGRSRSHRADGYRRRRTVRTRRARSTGYTLGSRGALRTRRTCCTLRACLPCGTLCAGGALRAHGAAQYGDLRRVCAAANAAAAGITGKENRIVHESSPLVKAMYASIMYMPSTFVPVRRHLPLCAARSRTPTVRARRRGCAP